MPWGRIDDDAWRHPRFDSVSPVAFGLVWAAVSYSNEKLLDGHLSHEHVVRLTGYRRIPMDAITELVAAGLWEVEDGGWRIHDYLQYNPSKTKVLKLRADDAARKERERNPGLDQSSLLESPRARPARTPDGTADPPPAHVPLPGSRFPEPRVPVSPYPDASEPRPNGHEAIGSAMAQEGLAPPKTSSERAVWDDAIAQLSEAAVTSTQIPALVARYHTLWPNAECTARALARHLGKLQAPSTKKANGRAVDAESRWDARTAVAQADALKEKNGARHP